MFVLFNSLLSGVNLPLSFSYKIGEMYRRGPFCRGYRNLPDRLCQCLVERFSLVSVFFVYRIEKGFYPRSLTSD